MAPHTDTNAPADASEQTTASPSPAATSSLLLTIANLQPSTAGSAGLDLATSITVTLLETSVHLLPTGIFRSPGQRMHALFIGWSSTSLMGLIVLPGVIDSDPDNENMIMAWTLQMPFTVPQGN